MGDKGVHTLTKGISPKHKKGVQTQNIVVQQISHCTMGTLLHTKRGSCYLKGGISDHLPFYLILFKA